MRLIAVAFPFVVLASIELVLRWTGSYSDDLFADSVQFFPEWDAHFAMPKPADSGRVFVVGGSTSWGFGVDEPFGLLLQRRIKSAVSGRRWEVVNGGVPAYGSHRVLETVRRACRFDPDLVVVYIGHNEFLEDVFYDPDGLAAKAAGARRFARQLRLVRCLGDVFRIDSLKPRPKLQQHFFGNTRFPLIKSREEYDSRIAFLKSNVRQMIAVCRETNTPVLFIPEVTNLLEPPGDSLHGSGDAPSARWEALLAEAKQQTAAGEWPAALKSAESLLEIDADYAEAHHLKGRALLGLGRTSDGLSALLAANQRDWRGDRANSEICGAILETCREEGVPGLDIHQRFWEHLASEQSRLIEGKPLALFLDHCHPTQAGHQIIADASGPIVLNLLGATEDGASPER